MTFWTQTSGTCACSQVSWSGRDGSACRLGSDLEQTKQQQNRRPQTRGCRFKLPPKDSPFLSFLCSDGRIWHTEIHRTSFCLAKPSTAGSLGLCHPSSMKTLNSCQPASLRLRPVSVSNHLHLLRAGPASLCRIPASSSRLSARHRKEANFHSTSTHARQQWNYKTVRLYGCTTSLSACACSVMPNVLAFLGSKSSQTDAEHFRD